MGFHKTIVIACVAIFSSCEVVKEDNPSTAGAAKEINNTREQFWAAARAGNLDSMLSFHLNSPAYRLYEMGEAYDYTMQSDGHRGMKDQGISRIDFNVQVMDTMVFNKDHAMETWDGTTVTWFNAGRKDTSGRFIVTIFYQHTPGGWKFSYLHSSNKPK